MLRPEYFRLLLFRREIMHSYHLLLKLKCLYCNGYIFIIISTIMHLHIYYIAIYPYIDYIKAVISTKVYICYTINFRKPTESYRQVDKLIWCQFYVCGIRYYIDSVLLFMIIITVKSYNNSSTVPNTDNLSHTTQGNRLS